MSPTRRKIKVIVILAGITILAAYALFETRDFIAGPRLSLSQPPPQSAAPAFSTLTITGRAEKVSWLTLNGQQIFSDQNGYFSERRVVLAGLNRWQIKAVDRFGQEIVKLIEIVGI